MYTVTSGAMVAPNIGYEPVDLNVHPPSPPELPRVGSNNVLKEKPEYFGVI